MNRSISLTLVPLPVIHQDDGNDMEYIYYSIGIASILAMVFICIEIRSRCVAREDEVYEPIIERSRDTERLRIVLHDTKDDR